MIYTIIGHNFIDKSPSIARISTTTTTKSSNLKSFFVYDIGNACNRLTDKADIFTVFNTVGRKRAVYTAQLILPLSLPVVLAGQ